MRRTTTAGLLAALMTLALVPTAVASHEHFLVTPGICVEDIASGQTSIDGPDHGVYHQFTPTCTPERPEAPEAL